MSGHTKGPWGSAANPNTGAFRIVCGYGVIIAERSGWPSNEAESAANARLIAAAPDLLEACEALVAAMRKYEVEVDGDAPQTHIDMMFHADAAISRARTGESASPDCSGSDGQAAKVLGSSGRPS